MDSCLLYDVEEKQNSSFIDTTPKLSRDMVLYVTGTPTSLEDDRLENPIKAFKREFCSGRGKYE